MAILQTPPTVNYFINSSTMDGCGRGMIEVDVTSPLILNLARHAFTADLTEDTSPVITKYPFPPKPLAILKSTILTLEAFTATSAAMIAVKAEIVSIAPTAWIFSVLVIPEIAGSTSSRILSRICVSIR